MGACHSADGSVGKGDGFDDGGESCPTVFELEQRVEGERAAATRLHVNLVNVDFRRGLFEVYQKGPEIPTRTKDKKMFVATNKVTGKSYAVTEVALPESRCSREVDQLWKGFDAQAVLDHPNICRLQEIFCSEERYYVVTDLCSGGGLLERLEAQGRCLYEEPEAADIVRKVAGALRHCHSESMIHGNLRVESCLFEDTGPWADVRLVDAGARPPSLPPPPTPSSALAGIRLMRSMRMVSDTSKSGLFGSSRKGKGPAWYTSPELRRGEPCSKAGDMWTLGVLAYLVLMGPLPQPGMTQEAAWAGVMIGKPVFKGRGWKDRSPEAADFVSRLLQKDPEQRMTAAEALEHPWISRKGPLDVLSPNMRASLCAFKNSCVMRRLGLLLVGHTMESAKLVPAKIAFSALDPTGKGFITEEALVKGLQMQSPLPVPVVKNNNHGSVTTNNSATPTASTQTAVLEGGDDARELFRAMDPEGSGRVGFSAFLAACLAGRPADEAGARAAFARLDRHRKDAVATRDLELLTGKVLTREKVEESISDAHHALDLMSLNAAGPVGAAVRETEARKSAASGAAGGFTYAEFYRLLAAVPSRSSSLSSLLTTDSPEDDGSDYDTATEVEVEVEVEVAVEADAVTEAVIEADTVAKVETEAEADVVTEAETQEDAVAEAVAVPVAVAVAEAAAEPGFDDEGAGEDKDAGVAAAASPAAAPSSSVQASASVYSADVVIDAASEAADSVNSKDGGVFVTGEGGSGAQGVRVEGCSGMVSHEGLEIPAKSDGAALTAAAAGCSQNGEEGSLPGSNGETKREGQGWVSGVEAGR